MNEEFLEAIEEIKREKDLDEDVVVEAFKEALTRAFRDDFGLPPDADIRIDLDLSGRSLEAAVEKEVVEEVQDFSRQIDLATARNQNGPVEVGDTIWYSLNPSALSRTATHQIKQIMGDRIQSGVQQQLFNKYEDKHLQLVNGVVRRVDEKTVYVALDEDVEAILPYREQVDIDDYAIGNRMKFLIVKVRLKDDGLMVVVSRTHPVLIERLFELHIPEVHDGLVEVMDVAREAGTRSKVAVKCHDPTLDPIGTCVGPKSSRIQSIVDEINGEKIDIIPYEDDLVEFIKNALSPAEVDQVNLLDDDQVAQVVVPEDQLSLAIGKGGQNARLTAKLVDWSIDIYSKQEFAELQSGAAREVAASIFKDTEAEPEEGEAFVLTDLDGVGPGLADNLRESGLEDPATILEAGLDALREVPGIGDKKAESIMEQVAGMVKETLSEEMKEEERPDIGETPEEVKESLFGSSEPDTSSSGDADAQDEENGEDPKTTNQEEEAKPDDETDEESDTGVSQIAPGESVS